MPPKGRPASEPVPWLMKGLSAVVAFDAAVVADHHAGAAHPAPGDGGQPPGTAPRSPARRLLLLLRTHRESWEPGKQMPLRNLGIAKLDCADGVGHPIGTDVERIGKQRLARMNRCALPDVVADIVRVAPSHHLDVAAAGGPDGASNAVPGVTEATAMGPNGGGDAGHFCGS
jgi:hypothetical protein